MSDERPTSTNCRAHRRAAASAATNGGRLLHILRTPPFRVNGSSGPGNPTDRSRTPDRPCAGARHDRLDSGDLAHQLTPQRVGGIAPPVVLLRRHVGRVAEAMGQCWDTKREALHALRASCRPVSVCPQRRSGARARGDFLAGGTEPHAVASLHRLTGGCTVALPAQLVGAHMRRFPQTGAGSSASRRPGTFLAQRPVDFRPLSGSGGAGQRAWVTRWRAAPGSLHRGDHRQHRGPAGAQLVGNSAGFNGHVRQAGVDS